MKSDYASGDIMSHILAALMYENRLALLVSMQTGLRIDDVLHLKTADIRKDRFSIKEMKTGKRKYIRISKPLRDELFAQAGRFYVFEGRNDPKKPRTRQAVYKDIKRAQTLFRVKNAQISPHSARKIYAVEMYKKYGNLKKVQELLNHSNEAVTLLYAMADSITENKHTPKKRGQTPSAARGTATDKQNM